MTLRTHQHRHGRARLSVRAALSVVPPFLHLRRAEDCAPYLVVFLLLAWQTARAQLAPADDFFNGGAQLYISNNIPAALERVELGLKTYPDDVKLKKLEELLKQQQQSQSQQNQQQNQSQQSKDNQQPQQQKSSGQQNQPQQKQNSPDQQKQDEQKQNQAEQKKDEQQKSSAEKKDGQEKQDEQGQPVAAGQMTPEEAKRLLDSQKDNEQVLQWKPQGKPENQNRPVKDW